MDRKDTLKSMFDQRGAGLEIGASYNPLLRKSEGFNIKIADYAQSDDLERTYQLPSGSIEHVDYVTDGVNLLETIGPITKFDYVIASHVIEHAPNFIKFLNDCASILSQTGSLVLAVPDKRNCFDVFRSLTSVGDVLEAFTQERTRHTAGKLFDHKAYAARRVEHIVWPEGYDGKLNFVHSLAEGKEVFENYSERPFYQDCHSWFFTPSSFRLIISDLNDIGYISLRETTFIDSTGPEFYIALSRNGTGPSLDRMELAKRTIQEINLIATN